MSTMSSLLRLGGARRSVAQTLIRAGSSSSSTDSKKVPGFMFALKPSGPVPESYVESIIKAERVRQLNQLILIPSESICFPKAAEATMSDLQNIYCEGQPMLQMSRSSESLCKDAAMFKAWHNRLSDGRFYRGCEEGDRVELAAKHNIATAFSLLPGSPSASNIYVNVQALSGSPANLAIYSALLKNGDRMLSLDLTHGGHLSHGSPYNVSGKQYLVTHYGVDTSVPISQRRLDYDRIRAQAKALKPRMIIGGASAYPFDWDWATLRSIADEVGALLLADVCHYAGMIVGGQLNNPLPHADVVMFTTHKTLMGPRGAAIVTKNPDVARAIDTAVFPGFQGGPHMNSIAGIAMLFETILNQRDDFCRLQRQVISNASLLAKALLDQGLNLEYGGTGTHVLLIDLKSMKTKNGEYVDGEAASRLLENVGIICNKNTLPGDRSAADSSGLRFGLPWLTQRGISEPQIKQLAASVSELLTSASAFKVYAPSGDERARARVPFETIQKVREQVLDIAKQLPYPQRTAEEAALPSPYAAPRSLPTVGNRAVLSVRGEKARLAMHQALSCDVLSMKAGDSKLARLYKPDGSVLDEVVVTYLGHAENAAVGCNGEERFALLPTNGKAAAVHNWLVALSDGYAQLDAQDLYLKVDGPLAVEAGRVATLPSSLQTGQFPTSVETDLLKPFFIGQKALVTGAKLTARPRFEYKPENGPLKKTVLHKWHAEHGGKMVPFGGWEMPVEYSKTGIFAEHAAVRGGAGLFDVSHMSALEVSGPHALGFLETVFANSAARLGRNEAQYSYMLRENGTAVDDLYVYRLGREKFMVVVNAGNFEHDYAWLTAVNEGRVMIDEHNPAKRLPGPVVLRPLRDVGPESVIDLAFQGPASIKILQSLTDPASAAGLATGKLNDIHHIKLGGMPVMACRTGYTGEEIGYELFVHPERAVELWEMLLHHGASYGTKPIGLGARDSLRTEAGFPLFGHELEGPEALSLTESDYGFVSRLHRPFYVGRQSYIDRLSPRSKRLLRVFGNGRKTVRAGHSILDNQGKVVGVVTSSAFTDPNFNFCAIAAVRNDFQPASNTTIQAYRDKSDFTGSVDPKKTVDVTVKTRFPSAEEKRSWQTVYTPFMSKN